MATLRVERSLGTESLDPIWRVIAWSLNAAQQSKLLKTLEPLTPSTTKCWGTTSMFLASPPLSGPKVAYGGTHPSVDLAGRPFVGARAHKAGKKLAGGPYAMTSIRL